MAPDPKMMMVLDGFGWFWMVLVFMVRFHDAKCYSVVFSFCSLFLIAIMVTGLLDCLPWLDPEKNRPIWGTPEPAPQKRESGREKGPAAKIWDLGKAHERGKSGKTLEVSEGHHWARLGHIGSPVFPQVTALIRDFDGLYPRVALKQHEMRAEYQAHFRPEWIVESGMVQKRVDLAVGIWMDMMCSTVIRKPDSTVSLCICVYIYIYTYVCFLPTEILGLKQITIWSTIRICGCSVVDGNHHGAEGLGQTVTSTLSGLCVWRIHLFQYKTAVNKCFMH